eukprot:TRINITY_DN5141_c0_g1_i1.p1 TRINITY_DN5141_c0_g1~~TRINITY_DN5141_c0_g1_i1.p1  ORF type:complete len:538 (+),score=160.84 TRINITY_DN5141_c0_g1_i1:98-1711(+)
MTFNLTDLLKEGYKHLSGANEAVFSNIEACKGLAAIVRTSLGPNGMNKIVVNHLEKLFVTNDAATIIKELDVIHPAAKIAVLASQMQETEVGDGTNFVLVLIGELLSNAEALLQKGLHTTDIIAGYSKAGDKAQELLNELVMYKLEDIRNEAEVAKALRSAIASKQFGYEDLLSPLIARACIQVCPKNPKNFNVDNVRVAKILGGGVFDTQVVNGHVVTRDTDGTIKHLQKVKVAIFAGGIDAAKTETKDTVLITSADQLLNYNRGEEQAIEKVIKAIAETGAKVLVAGGPIGELAMHFIERYQMMVIKVLSKFELRRVAKAVGATPVARLGAPTPEELGYCDVVTVEEIGSTKVTIFRQEEESKGISTLLVRASTQNLLDDFERSIEDGVNVYKGMARDGRFVPGAGATEIELARRVQAFGDATPGLVQYAIRKFADAFEVVPRTLSENAGHNPIDMIPLMYAAHQDGNPNAGIDIEGGVVADSKTMAIYDLLSAKSSAIRLVTDAVCTILRVDQLIMAKPAGGPKPPQQGGRDED